jgi:hypothetical protein
MGVEGMVFPFYSKQSEAVLKVVFICTQKKSSWILTIFTCTHSAGAQARDVRFQEAI